MSRAFDMETFRNIFSFTPDARDDIQLRRWKLAYVVRTTDGLRNAWVKADMAYREAGVDLSRRLREGTPIAGHKKGDSRAIRLFAVEEKAFRKWSEAWGVAVRLGFGTVDLFTEKK